MITALRSFPLLFLADAIKDNYQAHVLLEERRKQHKDRHANAALALRSSLAQEDMETALKCVLAMCLGVPMEMSILIVY